MTRRFAVVAALGAAALAFAADDPNAPLANTKRQLESLKKDEAAQKAGTQSGAKLDLPSLNTPGQELDLPPPKREGSETNNKSPEKNWLLDGYDKLERKRASADGKRGDDRVSRDEKPLDPNDPNYFLRVYERQRAERDAKQLNVNAAREHDLKSDAADPLAPFLKDWLANSPVREVLKETIGSDASGGPAASEGAATTLESKPVANAIAAEGAKSVSNPYVQALGLPASEPPRSLAGGHSPAAPLSSPVAAPAPNAPASTIYGLPERPKPDLKHALPPPPAEDKKYFPQLKKF